MSDQDVQSILHRTGRCRTASWDRSWCTGLGSYRGASHAGTCTALAKVEEDTVRPLVVWVNLPLPPRQQTRLSGPRSVLDRARRTIRGLIRRPNGQKDVATESSLQQRADVVNLQIEPPLQRTS